MRLVDAEIVKKYLKRVIWGADIKIDRWVDCAPTIDAIPVEWLHKKREQMIDAAQNTPEQAIAYVLWLWKKEQGAQDGKA